MSKSRNEKFSVRVAACQLIEAAKNVNWLEYVGMAFLFGGWVLLLNLFTLVTGFNFNM